MQQREILDELNMTLSKKQISGCVKTSYYRLNKNLFCHKVHYHIKKCNSELINQLSSLINENDIDVKCLFNMGLFYTVRKGCTGYRISINKFEDTILCNEVRRQIVIHNMLYAINLIDHNTLQ